MSEIQLQSNTNGTGILKTPAGVDVVLSTLQYRLLARLWEAYCGDKQNSWVSFDELQQALGDSNITKTVLRKKASDLETILGNRRLGIAVQIERSTADGYHLRPRQRM